jgi:hypothetical protein
LQQVYQSLKLFYAKRCKFILILLKRSNIIFQFLDFLKKKSVLNENIKPHPLQKLFITYSSKFSIFNYFVLENIFVRGMQKKIPKNFFDSLFVCVFLRSITCSIPFFILAKKAAMPGSNWFHEPTRVEPLREQHFNGRLISYC